MVTFVLSIAITCFDVQGVPQRVITGVVWLFIFLLIGWAVVTGWMDSTGGSGQTKPASTDSQSIVGISRSMKLRIDRLKERRRPSSQLAMTNWLVFFAAVIYGWPRESTKRRISIC